VGDPFFEMFALLAVSRLGNGDQPFQCFVIDRPAKGFPCEIAQHLAGVLAALRICFRGFFSGKEAFVVLCSNPILFLQRPLDLH